MSLPLIAALAGQRIGDELQDRRLDRLDQIVEAVGDRLLDVAVELHAGADLDEIDRNAGIGAEEAVVVFLFPLGAFQHELDGVARRLERLVLEAAANATLLSSEIFFSDQRLAVAAFTMS